jgi:hypothetical protein
MGPKQPPDNIPLLRTLWRLPSLGTDSQGITPWFVFTRWKSKVVKLFIRDKNKERKRCKNLEERRYLAAPRSLSTATMRTQRRIHGDNEEEEHQKQEQKPTAHAHHRLSFKRKETE